MNGSTNLRKHLNRPATLTILMVAILAVANGCRTAQPILQSVIVKDTVIVTETKYLLDTLEVLKDTTIYQDKVRIQLKYIDRKVVIEGVCEADTVLVAQTKVITTLEPKRKGWNFDQLVFGSLVALLIIYLFKRWVDKLTE